VSVYPRDTSQCILNAWARAAEQLDESGQYSQRR
jgi:hypothetical protein